MSDLTYRLKSESGLSEEFSLTALEQMTARGQVGVDQICTSDNGETWMAVSELISAAQHKQNLVSSVPDDLSSVSASDTTVKASSETNPEGLGPRKLKRMAVGSGKSRFSKATSERSKQKIGDVRKELDDLVGSTLPGGRYKVLSQFGAGSMAYVFRASDNRLETDVIIKIPKPEKITTDDFRERFKRESQLLVRLSHPHVVKVVDVGEFDSLPYVVMQLLSGGTLLDRMRNDSNQLNQMDPKSLQTWLREVARALDFCFKKGMVHRDVKPANILFDEDDNAYVSDFGLTKIMHGEHTELCSSGTANGVVLGTPNYLSPEIILGAKFDGRADQYSLAMTVYHVLCGRPPMQGASATATMINQTQKKLELLSSFRTDVPRELALAVQKGMEKNPKNRFDTSEDFAMAVLEGLRSDASSSSSITPPAPAIPVPDIAFSTEEWHDGSSSSSKKKQRTSASPAQKAKKKSSSASSAARRKSDWQAPTPKKLPPRKGVAAKTQASKRKAATTNRIAVFGHEVHPAVLAIAGIFVFLPTVIFLAFRLTASDSADGPITIAAADWTPDEYSPSTDNSTITETNNQNSEPRHQDNGLQPPPDVSVGDIEGPAAPDISSTTSPKPQRTNVAMLGSGSLGEMNPISPAEADSDSTSTSPALTEPEAMKSSASTSDSEVSSLAGNRKILSPQPGARVTHGSPGCPIIVVGNSVWNIASQQQNASLEGEYDPQAQTAVSPDGRYFAAASKPPGQQNTDVIVWDTNTGRKLFTAQGDSKRFVDSILLSKNTLLVGDRWSDELFVWECESGRKKKPLQIKEAKFKQGNTAISHNGEFVAAVAGNQLCVFKADDGGGVVKLANPRAASRKQDTAEVMYASLQSLSFSADNSELATISTVNGTKLLCWNARGEIVLEKPLAPGADDRTTMQWFANRRAWLLGPNIFDRDSEMVLLAALSGDTGDANVQMFDDNHLCGYFANNPTDVTLVPIPWDEIDSSVLVMKGDVDAVLRPGTEVSVDVNLGPKARDSDENLRKALRSKLVSGGLSVSENQRTRFVIRITADNESFVSKRSVQLPKKDREHEAYPAFVGRQLVMELQSTSATNPVWSVSLGEASSLLDADDISETERDARTEQFVQAIYRTAVPFYIPANEELIALPAVLW